MVWSRSLLTSSRLPAPLLKRFYAAPSPVTRASSYIPPTTKFTKIMCTVGPASESHETLTQLIERGARVFRLNFSHGDFESHGQRLDAIRAASRALQIPVAVCGDLQGPKIRVGTVPTSVQVGDTASRSGGGLIHVHAGDVVVLSATATEAHIRDDGTPVLSLTYKDMVHEVEAGHLVLINDGAIRMRAIGVDGDELKCQVLVGGDITSGKGINLPESNIKAPAITDKDWACVEWAMAHDLDYVALSFVRNANEVNALKAKLSETDGHRLHIISKIEKPQAVDNLHQIVEASDGVMVARGDLGVEMELATVPIIQKHIIETCQLHGKPCIIATQMLESMITSVIPTRAEASDVANAIFDGADAVMLSAESATGAHPALVVETMGQIIEASEGYMRKHVKKEQHAPPTRTAAAHHLTASLAYGAWHVVQETKAKMVVCWSQHGNAARFLSQYDFTIPILAFSEIERSVHQMALFNGVTPVHMAVPSGTASFIDATEALLLQNKLVTKGDMVLFLGGRPSASPKARTP
ncbi:pyruvate kinase [Saprolegnia parasitica CBS 223.65]|uniref:Pyruvate kinase n=1 Tax=Saprolegnia parasitica (strain CBS 223.65) TaxID=695850 RepID=A0A067CG37_SAPPC|nr:pyruvate kinase [Saprolegnia parasitica CBS 223.65]KDO25526.1 pyruvate kinase [Saprolegnia parasitica CBS 223.65]|eukprot:XP_012203725.1 pyruvate kinase [Saprolegnia parasitica CBS 223.65]